MSKDKNEYLNVLKGISCVVVIFLHCPFPGIIGEGIIYGIRFSVPIFFMISGYFCFDKEPVWVLRKSKYIFKLLFFSELFYGCWTIIKNCFLQECSIAVVLEEVFLNKSVVQILFCGTIFNGVLWYLYAMFWTWLFVFIIKKFKLERRCYVLIPVLLLIQVFGRFYVQNHYDISKLVFLFRNALTFGIPFVLLGMFISQYKEWILEKIKGRIDIILLTVGFLVMIMEYIIVRQYMDVHISTIILSTGLFLLALRPYHKIPKVFHIFMLVGRKWYTWVYLSHVFFIDIVNVMIEYWGFTSLWVIGYLKPVFVCVLACIFSEIMERVCVRVRKRG